MSTTSYLLQLSLFEIGTAVRFTERRSFRREALERRLQEIEIGPERVAAALLTGLRGSLKAQLVGWASGFLDLPPEVWASFDSRVALPAVKRTGAQDARALRNRAANDCLTLLASLDSFVDEAAITHEAILDTFGSFDGIRTEADFKTQILFTQSLFKKTVQGICEEKSPIVSMDSLLLDGFLYFSGEEIARSPGARELLGLLDPASPESLADRLTDGSGEEIAALRAGLAPVRESLVEAVRTDELDRAQALLEDLRERSREIGRIDADAARLAESAPDQCKIIARIVQWRERFRDSMGPILPDLESLYRGAIARRSAWARAEPAPTEAAPAETPSSGKKDTGPIAPDDAIPGLLGQSVTQVIRRADVARRKVEASPVLAEDAELEDGEAASVESRDPNELLKKGNEYFKDKKYDKAVRLYQLALSIQPDLATAHFNLFQVRMQEDRLREAFESYGRAVEFNPALGMIPEEYEPLEILGTGKKGVVFRAAVRADGRTCALRVLRSSLTANATQLQKYQKEVERIREIEGEVMARPLKVVSFKNRAVVENELVEGKSLRQTLDESGVIPFERALWYARQIATGMGEAHRQGVLHRDLKPSNIYEEPGQRIRITDWGLISLMGTGREAITLDAFSKHYMPPEQKMWGKADESADIYATSLVLYEMLIGERLTPGLPMPSEVDDSIPARVDEIIRRGAHKEPQSRYRSFDEFLEAVNGVRAESFVHSPPVIELPEAPADEKDEAPLKKRKAPPGMILVAAGEFHMGSPDKPDQQPARAVHLDAFLIDIHPVTNGEYKAFVEDTGHRAPYVNAPWATPYNWKAGKYPRDLKDHPVVLVSWYDAQAYAEWAGKRLPTEAEWEKASRGTDGRRFPWGNAPDKTRANYNRNVARTSRAGQFEKGKSPCGCHDMAGNVWEWCADWYAAAAYASAPRKNPRGPASGKERVLRGGAWDSTEDAITCSFRYRSSPHVQNPFTGFRCAKDPG